MSDFFSEMRTVLGAFSILAFAPIAACSVPLEDGHFGCARGPCPASFQYCHSDQRCYAAPEPDSGVGIDAYELDAPAMGDAPVDAIDAATSDASDANLAIDTNLGIDDANPGVDADFDAPDSGLDATDVVDAEMIDAFSSMDVGEDASFDAGSDAPFDGGTDAPIDVGFDAARDAFSFDTRRDANADPGFFTVCRSNDDCVSRSCYFPNAEPYAFGYCTRGCTGGGLCSLTGSVSARCRSGSCVVECSSTTACPSGSRCLMTTSSSGVCLAEGIAPLAVPAVSCGSGMPCTIGECINNTCRRRCATSANCADGWRCVNLASNNVCVSP